MNSMRNVLRGILLAGCFLLIHSDVSATTYYVDYTNGADTNSGTSKTAPWKYAPGMYSVSGTAASTTINPGDSIILKGCVTWPNAAFPWAAPSSGGSSAAQIYIGVDKTWWDSTVSGCATAWNRPILNPGATSTNHGTNSERVILASQSYVTWDNLEIVNVLCTDDASGTSYETHIVDVYGIPFTGMIFSNLYIHGWVNPYFSVGTGTVTAGSYTITNFVPYGYSPFPLTTWPSTARSLKTQEITPFGSIPVGNNSPTVTAISGMNPYTITFSNTAGAASANCTNCVIQLGEDNCRIFAGNEAGNPGSIVENSVIDGSDTVEAQYNPYGDCGLTESNNNWCGTSAVAAWRGPQIWRNNVIRYVQSVAVGACTEWSGNLIEYLRGGTDPTGHTNGIECLDEIPFGGITLSYNNVIRHTNDPNPSSANGRYSIGLADQYTPQASSTAYVFNNVVYDTLQNAPFGLFNAGNLCCGSIIMFNNTVDGGPSWTAQSYDMTNSCPSAYTSCTLENNHLVSNISSNSTVLNNCGSNCTHTSNLLQSFSTANGQGYTSSEAYAYSPAINTGGTVSGGTNVQSICTTLVGINAAAGAACQNDTAYGVSYNTTSHTVTVPARTPINRLSVSSVWGIGAYRGSAPAPPINANVIGVQ